MFEIHITASAYLWKDHIHPVWTVTHTFPLIAWHNTEITFHSQEVAMTTDSVTFIDHSWILFGKMCMEVFIFVW
jgi:hypothetical protein